MTKDAMDFLSNECNMGTPRDISYINGFDKEYVTFSREDAIKAINYLVENAKNKIEIFHKIRDNKKPNSVIDTLKKKSNSVKIIYNSNFEYKNNVTNNLGIDISPNITKKSVSNLNFYHHKEMVIDDKIVIFGSLNFLTNDVTFSEENTVDFDRAYLFENVIFWIKKEDKK